MFQRAIKFMGIDDQKLPVSALKREPIVAAKAVLNDISKTIKELDELKKFGMRADYDEVNDVMSRLSDLSSKYFQLIPHKCEKDQIIRPIKDMNRLQKEYQVMDNLTNVEYTSRLLLAALYR